MEKYSNLDIELCVEGEKVFLISILFYDLSFCGIRIDFRRKMISVSCTRESCAFLSLARDYSKE